MNKTKIKKSIAVAYEEWVNSETGEIRTFAIKDESVYQDTNFYKVFLPDLLGIFQEFTKGRVKVLFHILDNIEPATNMFIGTMRNVAKDTDSSTRTVQTTINFLMEVDFLRKKQTGVYIVSPKYIIKGSHKKRMGIMARYNDLPCKEAEAEAMKNQTNLFDKEEK